MCVHVALLVLSLGYTCRHLRQVSIMRDGIGVSLPSTWGGSCSAISLLMRSVHAFGHPRHSTRDYIVGCVVEWESAAHVTQYD